MKLQECLTLTKGMNNQQLRNQLYNLFGEIFLMENEPAEALNLLNVVSSTADKDLLTKIWSLKLISST